MSQAKFIIGDTRDVTATLPDDSVDLILTSPPFLALRSYLPADHPDKGKEIGSEPTPAEFLATLLALTAEWERLLAPHGSICVELGDTYAGGGASGWHRDGYAKHAQPSWQADAMRTGSRDLSTGWPQAKSLCIIPELYAACLAYGRNVLTGEPSPAGQWRVRNLVRWVRPNPPVGALGDKFRPATSVMVVACKARDRWFDLDAVRTPVQHPDQKATRNGRWGTIDDEQISGRRLKDYDSTMSAGAPPLDWWNIPTHPYPGSHYATWPPELCRIPIESMCPRHVCRTCGQPRRRITKASDEYAKKLEWKWADETEGRGKASTTERNRHSAQPPGSRVSVAERETVGWSDCGHDDYRPGVVFDPFAGSGTTLAVATGHGRDAIGIDLDERNADLAQERVGMFLTVNRHNPATLDTP